MINIRFSCHPQYDKVLATDYLRENWEAEVE